MDLMEIHWFAQTCNLILKLWYTTVFRASLLIGWRLGQIQKNSFWGLSYCENFACQGYKVHNNFKALKHGKAKRIQFYDPKRLF